MIIGKDMDGKAQAKIDKYNAIAHSKRQSGNLELNEYRYLVNSRLDSAGNSYCYTCGAVILDGLPELAQVEEIEGYTASNIIPVCKHCFEASRGKDLKDWFNNRFPKYGYERQLFINHRLQMQKKHFGRKMG